MATLKDSIWADPEYREKEAVAVHTKEPATTATVKTYVPKQQPKPIPAVVVSSNATVKPPTVFKQAAVVEKEAASTATATAMPVGPHQTPKRSAIDEAAVGALKRVIEEKPVPVAEKRPAPKPGFNEEGLPVLFRPNGTDETRAIQDSLKGASRGKPLAGPSRGSTRSPFPRAPSRPSMPIKPPPRPVATTGIAPGGYVQQRGFQGAEHLGSKLASLKEREASVQDELDKLLPQVKKLQENLTKIRTEKVSVLQQMNENARRNNRA